MASDQESPLAKFLGAIPNRLQLAGGWIDQPFVCKLHESPPGSMVVVQIEPNFRPMERSGIASGTRAIASKIWGGRIPDRPREELVRELYRVENEGKSDPSGSQDMIGLLYPGVNRLDYDIAFEGGVFPCHVETCTSREVADWLESVLHLVPVEPRPDGYNPLETMNLSSSEVAALGESGKNCFSSILNRDIDGLAESLNETMRCWQSLLPNVVQHRTIRIDLIELLQAYQSEYRGAMYSGCGGGYLIVVSDSLVPGSFKVNVRTQ